MRSMTPNRRLCGREELPVVGRHSDTDNGLGFPAVRSRLWEEYTDADPGAAAADGGGGPVGGGGSA